MKKRRVVITGIGVIAPNGIGKNAFWEANLQGKSGIDRIKDFDTSDYSSKMAGSVKYFDSLKYMSPVVAKRTDRFAQFGVAATKMALEDAKLNIEENEKDKVGICLGSGLGGIPFHEEQMMRGYQKGINRLNPLCVPKISPNSVSGHISIEFALKGPNIVISTACSSGTNAIGQAFDMICLGRAELMVSGGVEAPLTAFTFGAYCALHVLSKRNDSPTEASRPFDKERDGFVMGEGAGILILEELSHALKRNAHIYAEIIGYGANSGAHHMVMPHPEGEDAAEAISLALKDAEIKPKEVDYISAHGTSTQANDKAETKAIKKVFGEHAYEIPVSSIKSMIGHTIGAAGAIEAVICALVIENNLIPPTINYENPDPDCDLDYVPNNMRKEKVDIVLSNSFGFGSNNAAVIIKRYSA